MGPPPESPRQHKFNLLNFLVPSTFVSLFLPPSLSLSLSLSLSFVLPRISNSQRINKIARGIIPTRPPFDQIAPPSARWLLNSSTLRRLKVAPDSLCEFAVVNSILSSRYFSSSSVNNEQRLKPMWRCCNRGAPTHGVCT